MNNQRLILFCVLFFSLYMLWDAWLKQGQPKPQTLADKVATASVLPGGVPTPTPNGTVPPSLQSAVPATVVAAGGITVSNATVKTDLFVAEISSQGGDLTRLELIRHKATEDKDKSFVLFDNGEKHLYQAQTGLIGEGLPNHRTAYRLAQDQYQLKDGQDTLELRLEAVTAGGGQNARAVKVYTFHRGSYQIDVGYEITNLNAAQGVALAPHAYFQMVRDGKSGGVGSAMMASTYTGPAVYTEEGKFQKMAFEDIAKNKAKFVQKASNGWIAMVQHYFVSAWLPQGDSEREFYVRKLGEDLYSAGVILPLVKPIAPGATATVVVKLYAGPQEQENLAKFAPGLDLVVDYGWLTIIAVPLFWVLQMLFKLVGNWGWAIILLTVLIKLMFFPLSAASYKSMAKMKLVTPKMMKIKEQYSEDRERLNKEMMELYKREKINPLGGCLPILVQIPVFIALYWVLLATVEMRYAPWLGWIVDLSTKDPYYILPLIMGATMLVQTKLNPPPPDPIQAKLMAFLPVLFTAMFLFFPSGLVLYWVVNNMLSIAQQWQITRMIERGAANASS